MSLHRLLYACLMAALVLMASTSFYVGMHVCGDRVRAVALLDEADGCGHQSLPPCHRKTAGNCCSNEILEHDGELVFATLFTLNPQPQFVFLQFILLPIFLIRPQYLFSGKLFHSGSPPGSTGRSRLSLIHILRI